MVPVRPKRSVTAARAASTVKVSGRPTTSKSYISPPCSRSRSPSARKRKSNLARSAVCAKWTNESKSMWLPAAGSLHTVVLLTPGKWAARWICLSGLLLMVGPSGGSGSGGGSGRDQAAGRA